MKKKPFILFFSSLVFFSFLSEESNALEKPEVISGNIDVAHVDRHTVIKTSDKAILHYKEFSVGKGEKVSFVQPSNKSSVLNKVTGNKASEILGKLESNGNVFLVNPNGIYFGKECQVNVGSLIASTLDIGEDDFLKDRYRFLLNHKEGSIQNKGSLVASTEGAIVLMAPHIQNKGLIEAKAGQVVLASGEEVTLDFTGDGLLSFAVRGAVKEALIENLGQIKAEGGVISLKQATAKKAITDIVNLEGIEEGSVFIEEGGKILLVSESRILAKIVEVEAGDLIVEGNIKSENVKIFGRDISIKGVEIDASKEGDGGTVLIGGDFQGKGSAPYASNIWMDSSSKILANSLDQGDGGLVVLWSKDRTVFDGIIEAKGGQGGGNGGFVETSSQKQLSVLMGRVDTFSPKGKYGDWLLDPNSITITTAATIEILKPYGVKNCSGTTSFGGCDCVNDFCYVATEVINQATSNVTVAAFIVDVYDPIKIETFGVGLTLQACTTCATSAIPFIEFSQNSSITTNGGDVNLIVASNGYSMLSNNFTITTASSTGGAAGNVNFQNVQSQFGYGLSITAGTEEGVYTGTNGIVSFTMPYISYYQGVSYLTVSHAKEIQAPSFYVKNTANISNDSPFVITTSGSVTFTANSIQMGSIDFSSSVTPGSLSLNASSISVGDIGNSIPPTSITFTGSKGVTSGLSSVAFSNIKQSSSSAISIPVDATLGGDSVVISNNGPVIFEKIDGNQSLTIDAGSGSVSTKDLGSNIPLSQVSITGADGFVCPRISTAGGQIIINPVVVLDQNIVLDTTANGTVSGAGIQISSVNASSYDLTLKIGGETSSLGNTTLSNLDIEGTGTIALSNITASGSIIIKPSVSLSLPALFSASSIYQYESVFGLSDITYSIPTVNLFGDITSSGGSISLSGKINLDSGSGEKTLVTLSAGQNISLTESADTTISGTSLKSIRLLAGNTLQVAGNIGDDFGNALGDVTISGNTVTFNNIITQGGAISVTGTVTLYATDSILSTNGADITINGEMNGNSAGSQNLLLDTSLSGSYEEGGILSLQALGGVGGGVNSSAALGYLSFTGKTIILNGNITTQGGDVVIISDHTYIGGTSSVYLDTTNGGNSGVSGSVTFTGLVDAVTTGSGAQALHIFTNSFNGSTSGSVILNNAFGSVNPLGWFQVSGFLGSNLTIKDNISTISGSSGIFLSPNLLLSRFDPTVPVIFNTAADGGNGSPITFQTDIGGTNPTPINSASEESLILNAGSSGVITLGNVGNSSFGGSLTVQSAGNLTFTPESLTEVLATGDIIIPSLITLTSTNTSFISSLGKIAFSGTISGSSEGSQSLTINAKNGFFSVNQVGVDTSANPGFYSLGNVSLEAAFSSFLGSGIVTKNGNVTLIPDITLTSNSMIDTTDGSGSGSGTISIISVDGPYFLEVGSGNASTIFTGDVGLITPLQGSPAFFIKNASSATVQSVKTEGGSIEIASLPLIIGGSNSVWDTTGNSSFGANISIASTLDAKELGLSSITLNAGIGSVTVGTIGGITPLGNVEIITSQTFNPPDITTKSGSIIIDASSVLTVSRTFTTIGSGGSGGNILFNKVDGTTGSEDFIVDSGLGNITLGEIGQGNALNTFLISSANNLNAEDIKVAELIQTRGTGVSSFNGSVNILGTSDSSLSGYGFTFEGLVSVPNAGLSVINSGPFTLGENSNVVLSRDLLQEGGGINYVAGQITTPSSIRFADPVFLIGSTSWDASSILLKSTLDGTGTSDPYGGGGFLGDLTANVGSGSMIFEKSIGSIRALQTVNLDADEVFLQGNLVYTIGDQNYFSEVIVSGDTAFKTTTGNISFYSSIETQKKDSSLVFSLGGGDILLPVDLGHLGLSIGDVNVFNSGSVLVNGIEASSLRIAGGLSNVQLQGFMNLSGLGGIVVDAGSLFIETSVNASRVFFRTKDSIINVGSSNLIKSLGSGFPVDYINAISADVGAADSPLDISLSKLLFIGADSSAYFKGPDSILNFKILPSNRPCLLVYNGSILFDCQSVLTTNNLFNTVPKADFYLPGIYSSWSWDKLSSSFYFLMESPDPEENGRGRSLYVLKNRAQPQEDIVVLSSEMQESSTEEGMVLNQEVETKTEISFEEEIREDKKIYPIKESVDFEFVIEFEDIAIFLLSPKIME